MSPLANRPLIPVVLALGGGIVIGEVFMPKESAWLMAGAFLFSALCTFALPFLSHRKRGLAVIFVFCLIGLILHAGEYRSSLLSRLANERKEVTLTGTLLEPPKYIEQEARLKVRAEKLLFSGKLIPVEDKIRVSVYKNAPVVQTGERLKFPARLRPFNNFNNPGRYDYERAMALKGFACGASVSDGRYIVPLGQGNLPFPKVFLEKMQRPVRGFLKQEFEVEELSLFRALILGERQGITWELREPFNRTGLGHILAVSGLHVGLIACVVFFCISKVLKRSYVLALKVNIPKTAALLTSIPVISYACLAGLHVSTQRALIMILVFLWSFVLGREREVWSTLALAAFIILCVDPGAPFTISFQLSFAAVIGILWLSPPVFKWMPIFKEESRWAGPILNPICKYFTGLLIVCFCATLFLMPITALYFHRISFVAIPANVTVLPILGFWVIPLGLLSCLTLPLVPQLASLLLALAATGLHWMMEIIRFWAGLDWASVWILTPNILEIVLFYALIFFLFFSNRRWWAKIGTLIVGICILLDVAYWTCEVKFNRDLKVTFYDVGQANCALVEFPYGKKMLIDAGGFPGSQFDVGRMVVAPSLWYSKILDLDFLVLSHPQADHMNGLPFIARAFSPEEFWYNGDAVDSEVFEELMGIVKARNIRKCLPKDLVDARYINGVKVEMFHPPPSPPFEKNLLYSINSVDLNNRSVVLKISYGGKSILFPGDIGKSGERTVVSRWGDKVGSDILLSPHHGSKGSSSWEFLRTVRPRICVISSGEGNFFGFPHVLTLKRLKHMDCRTIRIDKSGAVRFRWGPEKFEVKTFLGKRES